MYIILIVFRYINSYMLVKKNIFYKISRALTACYKCNTFGKYANTYWSIDDPLLNQDGPLYDGLGIAHQFLILYLETLMISFSDDHNKLILYRHYIYIYIYLYPQSNLI